MNEPEIKVEKTDQKFLGHLINLETNIGFPDSKKPMNFQMRNLSLLTGMNGVGKTLVLIQTWIISYITTSYLVTKVPMKDITKALQMLFDYSFDNNDFTGTARGEFEHIHVSFDIDQGKVDNLTFTCVDCDVKDIQPGSMPIYMSANTRLFTAINQYSKFKKLLNLNKPIEQISESEFKTLCEQYKIYDVLFMEKQLKTLSDPYFKIKSPLKETLKDAFKKDITHIFYDEKKGEIQVTEMKNGSPETYPVTRLSNGEQAMLNMLIY